jgi:hypothetical protein
LFRDSSILREKRRSDPRRVGRYLGVIEHGGSRIKEKLREGEVSLIGGDMERSPTLANAKNHSQDQGEEKEGTQSLSAMLQPSSPRK